MRAELLHLRHAALLGLLTASACGSAPPPPEHISEARRERAAPAPREEPAPPEPEPAVLAEGLPQTAEEFDRQWNAWRWSAAPSPQGGSSPPSSGSASGTCDRALRCCEAYVAAMSASAGGQGVDPQTACAGLSGLGGGAPGDVACRSAIDAFRAALNAAAQTVPSACQ